MTAHDVEVLGRADDAVEADLRGEGGAGGDHFGGLAVHTGGGQRHGVETREDRHSQHHGPRTPPPLRTCGRPGERRLRLGTTSGEMDREVVDGQPGDLAHGRFDGPGDVVQLQVDEELRGVGADVGENLRSRGTEQLQTHLEDVDDVIEVPGKEAGVVGVGQVEGNAELRVRGVGHAETLDEGHRSPMGDAALRGGRDASWPRKPGYLSCNVPTRSPTALTL